MQSVIECNSYCEGLIRAFNTLIYFVNLQWRGIACSLSQMYFVVFTLLHIVTVMCILSINTGVVFEYLLDIWSICCEILGLPGEY